MNSPAAEIFKAYDIRGIVGRTLTEEAVRLIGRSLATLARARSAQPDAKQVFAVGRDGRLSGPALADVLMEGLQAGGADVVDIGMVATPISYFAAHHLGCANAVSVTGSHNPPDYNGLKMVVGGVTLSGEDIQGLRRMIEAGSFASGSGARSALDLAPAYLDRIVSDARLARKMRIAIDCGNGVAGATAGELYRRLGCEVTELYAEVDGNFPNHHPDPSRPENLVDLAAAVGRDGAELGLAFDGDGDRLGVITRHGKIIYPDRQLMLFARDVLERVPGGQIVYDVKCSRHVAPWVRRYGGVPSMWKTGHSLIKARMKELGAPLAGEMSGHMFFGERWYGFDDAQYAGARLLEILSRTQDASAMLESLPDAVSTPELNLKMSEGEPQRLVAALQASARFEGATDVIRLDGVRVEYPDGFGLARASNTTPVVVLRFEADRAAGLARIQADFRRVLLEQLPHARLPF
ncbi:MAG: phosphomannomutase/phosphoglucomutase [Burkholderiales bacterium]|nr:phosphomannomutase/phosphoglucomutase [Burkholderiales bacterium]